MAKESDGFSDAAQRLTAEARKAGIAAVEAAFAAGRPVHEAGTGLDAGSTYRVWPDGRRERLASSEDKTKSSRTARTA